MPQDTQVINSFAEWSEVLLDKVYLPAIYNVALDRRRAELVTKIPRSSDDVDGLQVYITYLTEIPWAWRAMSEYGYTPTGAKHDAKEGYASLGCHASNAIVSLTQLKAAQQQGNAAELERRWTNILDKEMGFIMDTFPLYMRALLWSSQNSKHAIGKVDSVSGNDVTLDGSGMWFSEQEDRAKLFVRGMYVQAYNGSSKVGNPVKVTDVNKSAGTVSLEADPGLSSGDLFTCSDIAGLDQPYEENCPGILDVIDDDNTFQGIDRSSAGSQFQPILKDATGLTLDYELLSDFFHDLYDPAQAHTSRDVVKKYWEDNLQSLVRYTPGGMFEDGKEGITIDGTRLIVDDDIPQHEIIVPDNENWQIADLGEMENLFGNSWQQVPGRPYLERTVDYWMLLLARDTRFFGRMYGITES